jgi:hypothetical protein
MPELGPTLLTRLSQQAGFPRVTIHTPMVRAGAQVRQNRIHLTNAVSTAVERLVDAGMEERDAQALLQPVVDLAQNDAEMERQLDGTSVFVDETGYETLTVPFPLAEQVEVGSRYSITQLVEPAVENEEYAILALSLGGVGLYRASRFAAEYVEFDGLPEDLCHVLRFDQFEKSSGHTHTTSARGDSMHHGHGAGKDEHDAFVKRFVDAVRPVVTDWLRGERIPLVVVGLEDAVGLFLKENDYRDTAAEHRFIDPHALSIDDVIRLGWECMAPRFEQRRREAIDRFHAAENRAVDVYGVLEALLEGRVATLLVNPTREIRGTFDESTGGVHVDTDPEHATENLVDTAVARALETDTEIIVVDDEIETPAAILY